MYLLPLEWKSRIYYIREKWGCFVVTVILEEQDAYQVKNCWISPLRLIQWGEIEWFSGTKKRTMTIHFDGLQDRTNTLGSAGENVVLPGSNKVTYEYIQRETNMAIDRKKAR